jgi:hypothetical protein
MACGLSALEITVRFGTFLGRSSPTQLAPPVICWCARCRATEAPLAITLNLAEVTDAPAGQMVFSTTLRSFHLPLEPRPAEPRYTMAHQEE